MLKTLFLLLTSVVFLLTYPILRLLCGRAAVAKIAGFLNKETDEQVEIMEKDVDDNYKETKERIEKMKG